MKFRSVVLAALILGCFSCAPSASETLLSAEEETDGLWSYDTICAETYEAEIASERSYTISFWIRPENNYPDTCIWSLSNGEETITLTGSGFSSVDCRRWRNHGFHRSLELSGVCREGEESRDFSEWRGSCFRNVSWFSV